MSRALLLAVGLMAGCDTACEAQTEAFVVDESLSADDVAVLVEHWGLADSSLLECEDVCQDIYEEATGWLVTAISSCAMDIDDSGGTVTCAGDGEESCL